MGFTTQIVHLLCRLSSCRRGWPKYIARVGEGGRSYIVGTHYGLAGIFFPQEYIGSHSHSDGARGIYLPLVLFKAVVEQLI